MTPFAQDPTRDLKFTRLTNLTPEQIWASWTDPSIMVHWFCPRPWRLETATVDLRPGGAFFSVMCSPEDEKFPGTSCYLEVIPNKKLVWTNAIEPDYRPKAPAQSGFTLDFDFTCVILMEKEGAQTRYTAYALHAHADARQKHENMGFQEGWGAAFSQMEEWWAQKAQR